MSELIPSSNPGPVETPPPSFPSPDLQAESQEPLPPYPSHAAPSGINDANWVPWVRSWIRDVFIAVFISGVIILFFYQPVKVEGTSMMPRLTDQERIFINKFVYRLEPIHRGDVVVFWFPRDTSKSYIKRVIGIPGDTVEMIRGDVYVNGKKIDEPYILPDFRGDQSTLKLRVPPGEYYVLGDHRNSSNDSRAWGTVPRSFIYGKAQLAYWPMDRLGLLE
jgi:signal peptidase I